MFFSKKIIASITFLSIVLVIIVSLILVNNSYEVPNGADSQLGWTNTQKNEKMQECIDAAIERGACQCIVDVLIEEFNTLDDFEQGFEDLATFFFEVALAEGDLSVPSQIDYFADRIRQCP